jgi:DNA-directed RNA polymerase subunit K/omega
MDQENNARENDTTELNVEAGAVGATADPAPPIDSRFLFVDVAALRAKQLRRGARVRFETDPGVPLPFTAERVAMEEVRRGLVHYNIRPRLESRSEDHP